MLKREDMKVGTKVVPIGKSYGYNNLQEWLEENAEHDAIKFFHENGYLIIDKYDDDDWDDEYVVIQSWVFYPEDLILYKKNQIKIVQVDKTMDLPKYQTCASSGMDLMARCLCLAIDLKTEISLEGDGLYLLPNMRVLIKTGIKIKMPTGLEAQVRCRSGLALKNGIMVVNGIGTIDEDFTGEIGVILYNSGDEPFLIKKGDRIAQLVFQKVEQYNWDVVGTLEETERSDGGYGHTGVQSNI